MQKHFCLEQCGCYDEFDFNEDDNSNSWLIQALVKSIPVVIDNVLDEEEKQVIELIFYKGFSQKECTFVLGKSRSSINRTYHRALKKLEAHLPIIKCVLETLKEQE